MLEEIKCPDWYIFWACMACTKMCFHYRTLLNLECMLRNSQTSCEFFFFMSNLVWISSPQSHWFQFFSRCVWTVSASPVHGSTTALLKTSLAYFPSISLSCHFIQITAKVATDQVRGSFHIRPWGSRWFKRHLHTSAQPIYLATLAFFMNSGQTKKDNR